MPKLFATLKYNIKIKVRLVKDYVKHTTYLVGIKLFNPSLNLKFFVSAEQIVYMCVHFKW